MSDNVKYLPTKPGLTPLNPEFRNLPSLIRSDDGSRYCQVDLLRHVQPQHIIRRMAEDLAAVSVIPPSSIMVAGMGIFSAALSRRVGVERHGNFVPVNLMTALEQPAATAKSRVINSFLSPFIQIIRAKIAEIGESLKGIDVKSDDGQRIIAQRNQLLALERTFSITNATPEGIEDKCQKMNGYFGCIASEQGLFNTLFGLSYGGGKNTANNDLVLNAFDAEKTSVIRVGREGFFGWPVAAVVLFAQEGSIDTLLKASNGTGLAERFIKLAEKPRFGQSLEYRSQDKDVVTDYIRACCSVFEDYITGCMFMSQPVAFKLPRMQIRGSDHVKINEFSRAVAENFVEGGLYSAPPMRGFAGKSDIFIVKIAANLHCMEHGLNHEIKSEYIDAAIAIMSDLLAAHLLLLGAKAAAGEQADLAAVTSYLEGRKRTMRELKNSLRNTNPFRTMPSPSAAVETTIDRLIRSGALIEETEELSGKVLISVA